MAELNKLGRYQLKRVLGRGAMGVVYEGLDPSLNRRVAVKTILRNAAIDAETAQHYSAQFAREARAAGRLNHPNIVQVHDFAEEGDVAYLVMEFIQGRELRSLFEAREKFEPEEVVRIMGELLDALDFAHEAGVIHRDVKPANVMLDAQRRVKLADFGVARIQDSERSAAGTMVGTPAFMSPEQIQGAKIDRRTDIFSAGTILYQLLTGEQPFTGQGAWTVAKKIMQDDPPQPSSVVKSVSPVFDGIVNKALAKSPDQRYATAREFAAALRAVLAPAQPPAAASIPPAAPAAAMRPGAKASDAEIEFWRAIQNSTDAAEFEFYLEQFPEGTYAGLARHKIAKLKGASQADDTVRLEAEAAAKRKAEEEKARQEAEARARREAAEKARHEAEEKAKQAALENARREAAAKAKRDAEDRARRETEEKIRMAQALARLKQQEEASAKAKAKAPVDEDSTVALPPRRSEPAPIAAAPEPKAKSMAIPAAIAAVVLIGGVAAYLLTGRAPAPTPVAAPEPAKPAAAPAPAVDAEKIRRETEERLRKEFTEKAAAERAALEKSLAEKIAAEAAAAKKVTEAKSAAEKAAAEKAVAAAAAARAAAEKAAAEKATAERANAEKAAAERAAAERAAAERAATDKAAAEKAAAEKAAAEKAAAEKAAAEKQAAAGSEALLERFIQRVGRAKVIDREPAITTTMNTYGMPYAPLSILYVNDGSCGSGAIKEITIEHPVRNSDRSTRCISLADSKPVAVKPAAARPAAGAAAPKPAAAAPVASGDGNAQLERFIQRVGRDKVLKQEPPIPTSGFAQIVLQPGEVAYVNDGSCGPGRIKEITGFSMSAGGAFRTMAWPSRCISLD